jgi:hypothetical protein
VGSTLDYVENVWGVVKDTWLLRYRKVFHSVVDDKSMPFLYGSTVFVAFCSVLMGSGEGVPLKWQREHYVLDVNNGKTCL